jgi:hypothetical protein
MSDGLDPWAAYGAGLTTAAFAQTVYSWWQTRRSLLLVSVDEEVWHDGRMYDEYYVIQAINLSDRPVRVHRVS